MSNPPSSKPRLAAAAVLIVVAGAAVGVWCYQDRERVMRAGLVDEARRSIAGFEPLDLRRLTGTRSDLDTDSYRATKDRLGRLKAVDARLRSVVLLRLPPDTGRLIVLADATEPGGAGEFAPGFVYPRTLSTGTVLARLRSGMSATEGPQVDAYGPVIAAYAPLAATTTPASAVDVLGLEYDATGWRWDLWRAALEGAFYVWLALGLPFLGWLFARRQLTQLHVSRNLSEAVEQSHAAIMVVGRDGRIEVANRGLCAQMGFSREELIGRPWRDFREADAMVDPIVTLIASPHSDRPWEGEWRNRRKDGSVRPVRGVVTPVKRRDGALACFVVVFDDATEAKEREAELRDARDRAQAGDRAKGQFLATMSHEVRTPLNGIVGFTSLLLDTPLTTEQREYVQTIRMSTEALIQLTGDILDYARIESGKLKLDPLTCDPRECVEDTLDLLAPKADAKRIELLHRVADDVPAAVLADSGRLRQVLSNLIGNAIKFTDRGEVEVTVRRLPLTDDGAPPGAPETCLLEFAVRDTGIGIAPENHARLFRAFSQVDDSTTRRYGGTGLGLAICRNLVELMGGAIGLESEPGRGSTFRFTIRAKVSARVPPARSLAGLRLGLVLQTPGLRREMTDLARGWRADVIEAERLDQIVDAAADVVLVEVGEDAARELVARPAPLLGLPSERLFGLVPITLSNELRTGLRSHFRLLVNKPVHHVGFFALLAGSLGNLPSPRSLAQFGYHVLLVDDDAVSQLLVERVLAGLGCRTMSVGSALEALDVLRARGAEFDVVLVDVHMPLMDGISALKEIRAGRAGAAAQGLWIIALTADVREEQRARGMAEGLNDYLTKPLKPSDLELALRAFRSHRAPRTA
ncbi:MAG: response regulator [Opitutaceae bacterium]|nr:response regulator [Opitutaceae bacterium]